LTIKIAVPAMAAAPQTALRKSSPGWVRLVLMP